MTATAPSPSWTGSTFTARAVSRLSKAAAPPDEAGLQDSCFSKRLRKHSRNDAGKSFHPASCDLSSCEPAAAGGNAQLLGADSPAHASAVQTGDVEQIASCSELAKRDAPRKAGAGHPDGQGGGWEEDVPADGLRWESISSRAPTTARRVVIGS